ncbi:hypothetical protein ACVIHH_001591 [Bradyrhizobium sp. USDA 4518]
MILRAKPDPEFALANELRNCGSRRARPTSIRSRVHGPRQFDANKKAVPRVVVQRQLAAMPAHHGLRDRKAKSEAACLVHGAGLVSADERLQHFGPAVLWNPRTVVRDIDGGLIG